MKSNKFVIGSFAIMGISIAYFLLVYIPKQQETNLRKQTYELCLKDWNKVDEDTKDILARQFSAGQITKEELADKVLLINSKKDEYLTNCVEKRLQEYKK